MFESGSIHRIHGSVNRTHLVPCPIITWLSLRSKWAAGKARGGRISASIRNRRATQPPAHFHRNPPGRGPLAVFPRFSLDPYEPDMGGSLAAWKTAHLPAGE